MMQETSIKTIDTQKILIQSFDICHSIIINDFLPCYELCTIARVCKEFMIIMYKCKQLICTKLKRTMLVYLPSNNIQEIVDTSIKQHPERLLAFYNFDKEFLYNINELTRLKMISKTQLEIWNNALIKILKINKPVDKNLLKFVKKRISECDFKDGYLCGINSSSDGYFEKLIKIYNLKLLRQNNITNNRLDYWISFNQFHILSILIFIDHLHKEGITYWFEHNNQCLVNGIHTKQIGFVHQYISFNQH